MKHKLSQPKYWQLKTVLQKWITTGGAVGSFLPSEKDLMVRYSVSRNTVRLALAELQKAGLLEKRQGQASRVRASSRLQQSCTLRLAWLDNEVVGNPYYFQIYREVIACAARLGVDVDFIPITKGDLLEKYLRNHSKYAGGIYSSIDRMHLPQAKLDALRAVPNLVGVDIEENMLSESYVATDNADGMKKLTQYLIDTGHRHILFTGGCHTYYSYPPFLIRQKAFHDTLKKNMVVDDPQHDLIVTEEKHIYDARMIFLEHLQKLPALDAIVACTDFWATNCIYALQSIGKKIPEDISIAGFDGLWQSGAIHPRLTTVRQPAEAIASAAVEMLLRRAGEFEPKAEKMLIKPELILRESMLIRKGVPRFLRQKI